VLFANFDDTNPFICVCGACCVTPRDLDTSLPMGQLPEGTGVCVRHEEFRNANAEGISYVVVVVQFH